MLLDIMLPGLSGYEVLEYAKTMDIPVIFLTTLDRVLEGEGTADGGGGLYCQAF